ncbi:hypothetical protein CON15_19900 [Bacillus cereus]|uniref:Uncharacterized protein n=1 Tax=Bacillus thuringiensis TaxID=1428 RepID=A0AB36VGS4_BACTU|nr:MULTISPECIES: hypothetical protein [Bacillus cereus group]PDZ55806.1 hypothetical protein CON15_19900 [Bacillus cereus]PFO26118.1 hypothetical protein COJ78_28875 [Bacillus thuringiensis]PFS40426.1 hypothetical protein COK48_00855 [Bacillus thuringiensis]PFS58117.1 hypothetical protein COK64_17200 [Bacillus thuringiensis]PGZ05045.1 hypothetical protein COE48_05525 [Bacillus thuringiensis]
MNIRTIKKIRRRMALLVVSCLIFGIGYISISKPNAQTPVVKQETKVDFYKMVMPKMENMLKENHDKYKFVNDEGEYIFIDKMDVTDISDNESQFKITTDKDGNILSVVEIGKEIYRKAK